MFTIRAALLFCICGQHVAAFATRSRMAFHTQSLPSRSNAAPIYAESSNKPPTPSVNNNFDDETKSKREDLKRQLLESADNFKAMQEKVNKERLALEAKEQNNENPEKSEGRYVARLLRKIMSKIMKKKKKRKRTVLRSDAFATAKLEVGEAGNATIAIAEELAQLNPSSVPTFGWQGYGGGSPSDSKLEGRWKLRFTTAADATFQESSERGSISTSQEIDTDKGTLTNVIDFERGKLKGFRVVVAGKAVSDDEIDLTFKRVVILRDSRRFKKLIFPIPARLFRALNKYLMNRGQSNSRGPYFQIQYLDDDLRMHITGDGNWFIQSRLA